MKILILSKHFWPENFRINDIAKQLSKKHTVKVLSEKPSYQKITKRFREYQNIKISRFWTYPRSKGMVSIFLNYISFIFFGCLQVFKFRKEKFDLIFIYATSPIFQAIPALLFGKINKIPTVLWVQDLWPDVLEDLKILNFKFILNTIKKFTNLIYIYSDFIFVQSKSFKKSIRKEINKNIYLLYNPELKSNIKYKNIIRKKKILIFAGNLGKAQNLEIIIKASLNFKKQNLLIKIYGSGSEREKINNLIKKNNVSKIVKILKPVSPKRLKNIIAKSDGLFITLGKGKALSKTLPAKLQTYMSIGKPIISSADGELFNYVKNNKIGFATKSNDVKGLISSIKKINNLDYIEKKNIYIRSKKIFDLNFELNKWSKNLEYKLDDFLNIYNNKEK
jgi:glycosyltransferase involved in cell wall biosynthesis